MSTRSNNTHIDDINIRLMVPLITIVLCTACLCATTWAWYTASITSGTSTITAGVTPSTITITPPANTLTTDEEAGISILTDVSPLPKDEYGYYELEKGTQYSVEISNNGTSESGYNCLFTVKNGDELLGIFYTENFKNEIVRFTITPRFEIQTVKVKVDTMWGDPPGDVNLVLKDKDNVLSLDSESENQLIVMSTSDYALRQAATDEDIPEYSYAIRFIDKDTYFEIRDSISGETKQEVLAIADYKKEGYEFVSATYGELGEDDVLYLEIDTDAESTDFVIYYQKNVDDSSDDSNNIEETEKIDSEAESSGTPSEGTDQTNSEPPVLNDNAENTDNSDTEDTGNSESVPETPEYSEPDIQTENNDLNENDEEVVAIDSTSVDTDSLSSDITTEQNVQ